MKHLERTKPETLAAAALDLTPSHFTAAHEYAERLNAALARLGLTDRLTLPPAPNTAIDELPGVVDVPLRKTLSVLMGKAQQGDASALATLEWTAQVAESIFAGLHARASVYPLALPSHESLATLPQGVDALLPRKISTGWSVASLLADPTCDGIDDGVSLVRLLCDSTIQPTELKDDNIGWTCDIENCLLMAMRISKALDKVTLNCVELTKCLFVGGSVAELSDRSLIVYLPYCKSIANTGLFYPDYRPLGGYNNLAYSEMHLDALEECNTSGNRHGVFKVGKLYMPNLKRGQYRFGGTASYENPITTYLYVGCNGVKSNTLVVFDQNNGEKNNCTDIEIAEGACQNITFSGFDVLTEENILNHILRKLKQDEAGCGEGVTISIGTTNIDKLTSAESVALLAELRSTYGYTIA